MATVDVLRRQGGGRQKHGQSAEGFEFSHTIYDVVISLSGTDDLTDAGTNDVARQGKTIDAVIAVPHGADVTAQDRIELPDGNIYRIKGKPLRRRNDLTGSPFRTKIELVYSEG